MTSHTITLIYSQTARGTFDGLYRKFQRVRCGIDSQLLSYMIWWCIIRSPASRGTPLEELPWDNSLQLWYHQDLLNIYIEAKIFPTSVHSVSTANTLGPRHFCPAKYTAKDNICTRTQDWGGLSFFRGEVWIFFLLLVILSGRRSH